MASLTDQQRIMQKSLDIASQVVIDYTAPEVPTLENKTSEGLLEEWGRLNEARKAIEKVEKIVAQRFQAIVNSDAEGSPVENPVNELRGDNFVWKRSTSSTTRLNQAAAKERLAELGELDKYMVTSEVTRNVVKRI